MQGWIAAFVIIAALAIVLQAIIMFGLYLQFKKSSEQMTRVAFLTTRKTASRAS